MNLKDRARQLKTDIPAIWIALKHKETPMAAKVLAGIVIVYALSPVDLIPDFIPILGYLDDVLILPALIVLTLKLIPAEVMVECRAEAVGLGRGQKKWVYAVPFVLIWLLVLMWIVQWWV